MPMYFGDSAGGGGVNGPFQAAGGAAYPGYPLPPPPRGGGSRGGGSRRGGRGRGSSGGGSLRIPGGGGPHPQGGGVNVPMAMSGSGSATTTPRDHWKNRTLELEGQLRASERASDVWRTRALEAEFRLARDRSRLVHVLSGGGGDVSSLFHETLAGHEATFLAHTGPQVRSAVSHCLSNTELTAQVEGEAARVRQAGTGAPSADDVRKGVDTMRATRDDALRKAWIADLKPSMTSPEAVEALGLQQHVAWLEWRADVAAARAWLTAAAARQTSPSPQQQQQHRGDVAALVERHDRLLVALECECKLLGY